MAPPNTKKHGLLTNIDHRQYGHAWEIRISGGGGLFSARKTTHTQKYMKIHTKQTVTKQTMHTEEGGKGGDFRLRQK